MMQRKLFTDEFLLEYKKIRDKENSIFNHTKELALKDNIAMRLMGLQDPSPINLISNNKMSSFRENEESINEKKEECGERIVAFIGCDCDKKIPIYLSCNYWGCLNCETKKNLSKRKMWNSKLKSDKGRNWKLLTFQHSKRVFVRDFHKAVKEIHDDFRKLTKTKWWRRHARAWLGVIEYTIKEENGTPTFYPHLHVIYSGKNFKYAALSKRWYKYHNAGVNIKDRNPKTLAKTTKMDCLKYITKYMTKKLNDNKRKKGYISSEEITNEEQLILAHTMKGVHKYITGGKLRKSVKKVSFCCTTCETPIRLIEYDDCYDFKIDAHDAFLASEYPDEYDKLYKWPKTWVQM